MKRTNVLKKIWMEETALQKSLSVVFRFPEVEFSLTELSQKAGVTKSTAHRLLPKLLHYEIIKLEKKTTVFKIMANIGSFEYTKRKIIHNLNMVYQSGIVEFLDAALSHPQAILLFGSFRKGDDISTSDVDIAVETLEDTETQTAHVKGLEGFEAFFGRKVQILLFNRKKVDINVFNNMANGTVLSGFLEVKP